MRGDGEIQLGLWGGPASGKTHLINASAHYARSQRRGLQIYDAAQLVEFDAKDFDGFSRCEVLAIDNLDAIAGNADWEACFYRVINQCRDGQFRFLYTLSCQPQALGTVLDDFRSRLQWGLLLELPLNRDDEIRQIILRRARLLGIELSAEVISYLLTHHSRNLRAQMAILRLLDDASLSRQRRVTIPLVKQALAESPERLSQADARQDSARSKC